jgi:HEAT repeat protein
MQRAAPWLLVFLFTPATARAYIEDTSSLGRLIKESATICLLEVEKVSKEKRVIVFRKVADLKGKAGGNVKHHIGEGHHPREPKQVLDWAEPGKQAICFQQGKTAQVCLGHYWYECVALDEAPWWRMTRGVPERTLAYFGSVSRLRGHIASILAGKEVVITAVTHGTPAFRGYEPVAYKDLVRGSAFPVWRLRASLNMPRNVYLTGTDPKCIVGLGAGDAADVPPLLKALDDKDARARADAADELGMIGRAAKDAVPGLAIRAVKDVDPLVAIRAAEALLRIDPQEKFVDLLAMALGNEQPKVRRAAAESLGNSSALALAALPKLTDATKDKDNDVRWAAVVALGHIGPKAKPAVPALIAAMQDPVLRSIAADSLGAIGPDAQSAVPELARLIAFGDRTSHWPAAIALVRIGGVGTEAATPVFVEALKSKDTERRWDALSYLQRLGPRASAGVGAVVAVLKDDDAFIHELAVVASAR